MTFSIISASPSIQPLLAAAVIVDYSPPTRRAKPAAPYAGAAVYL
jgi:hypothetical protein